MSTATITPTASAGLARRDPSPARAFLRDLTTVAMRELRPVLREPFSLVFGLIQPLFFLALFAPLLVATGGLGEAGSLQWFVPGIIVMSTLFATSMTGSNLLFEVRTGAHERMLVTPLSRSALIVGRAVKEIVPVVAQSVLIVLVTIPFGFDPSAPGAVLGVAMAAVFGVGLGSLSYALALAVKDQDWIFWTVQQTFLFPLMLLAGMLLPLDGAPGWLRAAAEANPLRHLVDAERQLFSGTVGADVWHGAVATLAILVLGLWVGIRTLRATAE